ASCGWTPTGRRRPRVRPARANRRGGPTPSAWCEACGTPTRSAASCDPLPVRHLEEGLLEADRAVGGHRRHRGLPDEPAAVDHDGLVGHLLHLPELMARDEHRVASGREALEEITQPPDPKRV